MNERVFVTLPGDLTLHIGTVKAMADLGGRTYPAVKTYCGKTMHQSDVGRPKVTYEGYSMCVDCVREENFS